MNRFIDYVNNYPSAFTDAYFDFASILIYQWRIFRLSDIYIYVLNDLNSLLALEYFLWTTTCWYCRVSSDLTICFCLPHFSMSETRPPWRDLLKLVIPMVTFYPDKSTRLQRPGGRKHLARSGSPLRLCYSPSRSLGRKCFRLSRHRNAILHWSDFQMWSYFTMFKNSPASRIVKSSPPIVV